MPSCFLHRVSPTPVLVEKKDSFSLFFGKKPRSTLLTVLLRASMVSKKEKKMFLEAFVRNPSWNQFLCAWERWNSPPSPIAISSYPFSKPSLEFQAYKWSLHEESGRGQKKHPYSASLKFESEEKQRYIVFGEVFIVIGYCRHS